MTPFVIALFLATLSCFFKNSKLLRYAAYVYLILLCGLRASNIGADTDVYVSNFATINEGERIEFMFLLLQNAVAVFTANYTIYLTIVSTLILIPIFSVIEKESLNPGLSLLMYLVCIPILYFETFNILRQCIAVGFVFCAFYNANHGNRSKVIIFMVLAFLFHYTSLFAIPFFFLNKLKISFPVVFITLLLSVIFGLFNNSLEVLVKLFALIPSQNEVYLRYSLVYVDAISEWNFIGKLSLCIPVNLFAILIYNRKVVQEFYYKCFYVSVVIMNLFLSFQYIPRFIMYVTILQILLAPIAVRYSGKVKQVCICLFIMALSMFYLYSLNKIQNANSLDNNIVPYELSI